MAATGMYRLITTIHNTCREYCFTETKSCHYQTGSHNTERSQELRHEIHPSGNYVKRDISSQRRGRSEKMAGFGKTNKPLAITSLCV